MSSINAQLAVWLLLFIVVIVLVYGKKNGFALDKMGPAILGAAVTYFAILAGFWLAAQLGWWSLGKTSAMVSVDDKFVDGYSSIVRGDMLNSDGMSGVDLGDNESFTAAQTDDGGDHDHNSLAPSGPRSDAAVDPRAAVVEVVWPTPTPEPTPVIYKPTHAREKMMSAWKAWFEKANFNRGNTSPSKIPKGVQCRVVRTSSKGWFGFTGQNIWTMRCFDAENPDYGQVDINLTEQAKNQLGIKGDEGLVEGTGTWPNGFFVPEGQPQSQAPAFAPGPAPASSGDGPDAMQSQFGAWLRIDAPAGIPCIRPGNSRQLAAGSRHRFDPRSIRDNTENQIPRVEVLMNPQGATCWAQLWPGFSHAE